MTMKITPEELKIVSQRLAAEAKGLKSVAFDLKDWHSGPACQVTFVSGHHGIGVYICCLTCHCVCEVEATGQRISTAQSFMPGGQTP